MSSPAGAAAQPTPEAPELRRPPVDFLRRFFRRFAQGDLGPLQVIIAIAVIWAIFQSQESRFLTATNLTNLVLQITAIGLISVGVVLVLLLGEVDLSLGAVSGLCAGIMAVLSAKHGWSPYTAIAVGLLAGTGIGLFQGFVSTYLGIPPFVVTLAGSIAWGGFLLEVLGHTGTVNITDSKITGLANTFYGDAVGWIIAIVGMVAFAGTSIIRRQQRLRAELPAGSPAALVGRIALFAGAVITAVAVLNSDRGVPLAGLILVGFLLAVHYVTTRTRFGRHIFAVGGNAEAARRAGISLTRTRVGVFMIASSMAAIGGILAASRLLGVNQSSGGSDLTLLAIAGPVVAGTSLYGGRGSVWSALLGGILIGSISNGMDLLALSSSIKFIITGGVLLAAVAIDALARRRRAASGRV